ncbi:MAG: LamG-like jellyroll fold domain-containing protein, partial [Bdellovibrionia bacterium]
MGRPVINKIPQVGFFSWDFRLQSVHGGVRVFRPEALKAQNGVPNFNDATVYSDAVAYQESILPAPLGTPPCIQDPITLQVPDACRIPALQNALRWGTEATDPIGPQIMIPNPEFVENPYRSNCDGTPNSAGACETYKIITLSLRGNVLDPSTRQPVFGNGQNGLTHGTGTIVVRNPKTPAASIVLSRPDEFADAGATDRRYRLLRTGAGENIPAFEVTGTADGRLLVFNYAGPRRAINDDQGINGRLYYMWNQTATGVPGVNRFRSAGWSTPQPITNMYYDRDLLVDGVRFASRFPLAQQQMRRADGTFYPRDYNYTGAYLWISLDGSELFSPHALGGCFMAPCAAVGNSIAVRGSSLTAGFSVIGPWTGWAVRHIDGPINPDRNAVHPDYETIRVGPMSPGAVTSMWSPFKNVPGSVVPHTNASHVYPILVDGHEGGGPGYQEVSFDAHEDGDYFLNLPMNEMLTGRVLRSVPAGQTLGRTVDSGYDPNRTPDISGRFNSATLNAYAKFPADVGLLLYGYSDAGRRFDNNPGVVGRAVFFGERGAVTVGVRSPSLDGPGVPTLAADAAELAQHLTLELFVKRLATSRPQSVVHNLLRSEGNFYLSFLPDGRFRGTVIQSGVSRTIESTAAVATGEWGHVALVFDAASGRLSIFVNGALSNEVRGLGAGQIVLAANPIIVGPAGIAVTPGLAETEPAMLIDEVAISRVARTSTEIQKAAFALQRAAPSALPFSLPLGLSREGMKFVGPAPTQAQADLGKMLFFDQRLSLNKTVSCATCHQPGNAFSENRAVSVGIGG